MEEVTPWEEWRHVVDDGASLRLYDGVKGTYVI